MIGRITGRIDYRTADHVMIDVHGVGYIVHVSERTLLGLPAVGEAVALYTDLLVREDNLQLFGFTSLIEKEWYRLLTGVQGIGAKSALAIVGVLGAGGFSRAIMLGDWSAIRAAPGVGPRIAQRVVNELKDKAPAVMAMGAGPVTALPPVADPGDAPTAATRPTITHPAGDAQAEAMSALGNLGYGPSDTAKAVAEAAGAEPELDTGGLIRACLRLLAPRG